MRSRYVIMLLVLSWIAGGQKTAFAAQYTCENFASVSHRVADSIALAITDDNYPLALTLVDDWITRYQHLKPNKQVKYKQYLINAYYIKTCIYSGKQDTGEALTSFNTAVSEGYSDFRLASSDPNLDPLRTNSRFASLMKTVQERGDYLYVLRNSGSYTSHETAELPSFTYLSIHDPYLAKLRSQYHLSAIAGDGPDISKMIRLLHWVHQSVPHDGTRSESVSQDALTLLERSKRENLGLDCRGLAVILNEAYLAVGLRSRVLTCMPKDTTDREHHVLVTAFSPSLGKWLWMDPTNNVYVTDEHGELLGAAEIRSKMISGDSLQLPPDANLNGKIRVTARQYLYEYMAKNLYWFQCPLVSGYVDDAKGKTDYAALFPSDYHPFGISQIKLISGTAYITTDTNFFWQSPPAERHTSVAGKHVK